MMYHVNVKKFNILIGTKAKHVLIWWLKITDFAKTLYFKTYSANLHIFRKNASRQIKKSSYFQVDSSSGLSWKPSFYRNVIFSGIFCKSFIFTGKQAKGHVFRQIFRTSYLQADPVAASYLQADFENRHIFRPNLQKPHIFRKNSMMLFWYRFKNHHTFRPIL